MSRQRAHQLFVGRYKRQSVPCHACGNGIVCPNALPIKRERVLCLACVRRAPGATVGQRVQALRLAADLTRPAVAQKAGVVTSTVYGIERGTRPTTTATLEKLAKALGVSVAMLTGEKRLRVTPEPTRNGKAQRARRGQASGCALAAVGPGQCG
jgi:transcriptional regulator with XRE-family HTH domain